MRVQQSRAGRSAGLLRQVAVVAGLLLPPSLCAQQILQRGEATVMLEPYAPNIVRVTLSMRHEDAVAAPGPGILAHMAADGWTKVSDAHGDRLRSNQMQISVSPQGPTWTPTGTQADIAKFFNGSAPGVGLRIQAADGKPLVDLQGWQMAVPNYKDGTAWINNDRRPTDPPFYTVGATFSAAPDEHDYGMGQILITPLQV